MSNCNINPIKRYSTAAVILNRAEVTFIRVTSRPDRVLKVRVLQSPDIVISKQRSRSLGWDGVTVQQRRGPCALPSRLLMDAFRQMIDISTPCHRKYHGGLTLPLTIVDKCRYQTPFCRITLRFSCKCLRQGGGVIHPGNVSTK